MVQDYITYSNVSDVIDREVSKMDEAGFKFPEIIKGLYLQRQDLIFKEIVLLRVILTGRDIKIYEKNKVTSGVVYKFDCRMQEHTLFCLSEDLRKQSMMKLCELLEVDLMKCEVAIWQKKLEGNSRGGSSRIMLSDQEITAIDQAIHSAMKLNAKWVHMRDILKAEIREAEVWDEFGWE